MALLNYSKTLVAGTNENVDDVMDLLEEARASINSIVNAQIAAGANIDGAKFLDGSVTNAKLASGISGAKLLAASVPASALEGGIPDLAEYVDTQTSSIGSTGVLTGISVTPESGTYLILALAQVRATVADPGESATAQLTVRRNSSAVIAGPTAGVANSSGGEGAGQGTFNYLAFALGSATADGDDVFDVLGTVVEGSGGIVVVDSGVLAMLKVA